MSALRERQKKERRNQIIESARQLFQKNGYSKTNMDAIADKAYVGVATIYAYFENKEGVVSAITEKDAKILLDEASEVLKNLPPHPIAAVCELLKIYSKFADSISYTLVSEMIGKFKKTGLLSTTVRQIRKQQIEQVTQILEENKASGNIPLDLEEEIVANIILDLHDRHLNRMKNYPEKGADQGSLNKTVEVLFKSWLL